MLYVLSGESVLYVHAVVACLFENPHLLVGFFIFVNCSDCVVFVVGNHVFIVSVGVEYSIHFSNFGC